MASVAVFCGSTSGVHSDYARTARQLGIELAQAGHSIVYGGSRDGLMAAVADGALSAGGRVVGVMPEVLKHREIEHTGLTELHWTQGLDERKHLMFALSDLSISLPGGYGTLDELFEAITLNQIGLQKKPAWILNIDGFFDHLIAHVRHASQEGFVRREYLDLVHVANDVHSFLAELTRIFSS